ncbi:nuclear receptor corepressor 2-like isoform X2 [Scylla paramamosain]|uniref:nuclear receptor corepressor 2-like isoform X2 n=1 Tax=Scylla paramamosain TaxID=85552 RepID=UPI003083AC3B
MQCLASHLCVCRGLRQIYLLFSDPFAGTGVLTSWVCRRQTIRKEATSEVPVVGSPVPEYEVEEEEEEEDEEEARMRKKKRSLAVALPPADKGILMRPSYRYSPSRVTADDDDDDDDAMPTPSLSHPPPTPALTKPPSVPLHTTTTTTSDATASSTSAGPPPGPTPSLTVAPPTAGKKKKEEKVSIIVQIRDEESRLKQALGLKNIIFNPYGPGLAPIAKLLDTPEELKRFEPKGCTMKGPAGGERGSAEQRQRTAAQGQAGEGRQNGPPQGKGEGQTHGRTGHAGLLHPPTRAQKCWYLHVDNWPEEVRTVPCVPASATPPPAPPPAPAPPHTSRPSPSGTLTQKSKWTDRSEGRERGGREGGEEGK